MRIDIDGIIAAAVFLDREEEDLCRWEMEAELLSFGLDDLAPLGLSRRCQDIAKLKFYVEALTDMSSTIRIGIDDRQVHASHPDVQDVVERQTGIADRLDQRLTQLRRRLIDIDLEIGETIHALSEASLDIALVRLLGGMQEPMTEPELLKKLNQDRLHLSTAMMSWRNLQGHQQAHQPLRQISQEELAETLVNMETSAQAIRHPRPLRRTRWTFKQTLISKNFPTWSNWNGQDNLRRAA